MRRVHTLATCGLAGLLLQLACGDLGATTNVSGTVYDGSGGPWTLAGSPYRVTGDVTVPAGQTLTVEPGVVVKFNWGAIDLIVNGTLSAVGNAGARIYFTSDRDDSVGGDTNGDGNTLPYPDLWGCLRFTATSGGGALDYAEVRYGGWSTDGGIWIEGGQVSVTNSVLRDIAGSGIRVQNSNPTLTDNEYANNTWAAVSMDLASDPAISGATVTNNRINGLALDSGSLVGDRVWDDTDLVHAVFGNITVPAGQTLTLAPGLIVKVEYGAKNLIVDGRLLAQGTAAAPICFTALRDDGVGGDTDNNGANSVYAGLWGSIRVNASSTGTIMNHVAVYYGGWGYAGNLRVDGGELTLTDGLLQSADGPGIRIQQSNPVLTDCTYQSNTGAAISMDLASDPDIAGVTVSGNGTNGLVLDAGTLAGSLPWDDPDIVYVFYGDITVPVGVTLSIAAGQIIKVGYGSNDLIVQGALLASGTASAGVEFTTDRDDTVGGDTNGLPGTPSRGLWGGVKLTSSSTGTVMEYCRLSYGGWGVAGEVEIDQAGARLEHCTLRQSYTSGVRVKGATPVLQDTVLEGNVASAISMDLAANPEIHSVTLENNGVNGLTLDSGTLAGDASWDDPDIVYRLAGDVTVPPGVVLTIAPGQVVKVAWGAHDLHVQGGLLAQGTALAPVEFTSEWDDTVGGDTNNNGSGNSPYAGVWGGVQFASASSGSILEHCRFSYGGWGVAGLVGIDHAGVSLTDCTVRRSSSGGLRVVGASPVLRNTTFQENSGSAASMDLASNPDITGVTMASNGVNGLSLDPGALPGDGYWDDPDIVYRLSGDVTVPAGALLSVAAGQIVKFAWGSNDLYVQGTLSAAGTAEAPVVFTSEWDDEFGGDTNNGSAVPYAGVWGRIEIQAISTGNILENVIVRYGGWSVDSALAIRGGEAILAGCTIAGSACWGLRIEQADPIITGCTFQDNAWSAISVDLASDPTVTAPTLVNNGANALRFDAGTLAGSAIWDDTDIVHLLTGDVNVTEGSTLTLAPGLVVKVVYGGYDLVVAGTLVAEGTAGAPIVFTSDRDDSVGGDTNNDPAGPYPETWVDCSSRQAVRAARCGMSTCGMAVGVRTARSSPMAASCPCRRPA